MSVWYCEELDALVIRHMMTIDPETEFPCTPVEWDWPDMVRAKELRSKYKGVADLADLFSWEKIGDFD